MAAIQTCGSCKVPLELEWGAQIIAGKKMVIISCAKCGAVLGITRD